MVEEEEAVFGGLRPVLYLKKGWRKFHLVVVVRRALTNDVEVGRGEK